MKRNKRQAVVMTRTEGRRKGMAVGETGRLLFWWICASCHPPPRPWLTWCMRTSSPTSCAPSSGPWAARSVSIPSAGRRNPSSPASSCDAARGPLGWGRCRPPDSSSAEDVDVDVFTDRGSELHQYTHSLWAHIMWFLKDQTLKSLLRVFYFYMTIE